MIQFELSTHHIMTPVSLSGEAALFLQLKLAKDSLTFSVSSVWSVQYSGQSPAGG